MPDHHPFDKNVQQNIEMDKQVPCWQVKGYCTACKQKHYHEYYAVSPDKQCVGFSNMCRLLTDASSMGVVMQIEVLQLRHAAVM